MNEPSQYTYAKYGTAQITFEHYGIAYRAERIAGDIVLFTNERITRSQFREAFTVALLAFRKMDEALSHSLRETTSHETNNRESQGPPALIRAD